MEWRLTPTQDSRTVAKFISYRFMQDGPPTHEMGLLLGVMFRDIPFSKGPNMVKTFINEFV